MTSTGLVVDKAFFEACSRCGVEPLDLQPRKLKEFKRPGDEVEDPKVLALRLEGFERVRSEKMKRVAAEQNAVRSMMQSGVAPALVPVDQPWLVGGPKEKTKVLEAGSPQEMIEAMAAAQQAREAAMKAAEQAALQGALRRQAAVIERMIAGEKLTAEKAKKVAEREKVKAEEKAEEAKLLAKKAKEAEEKKKQEMVKAQMERDEDKKRLLAQMAKEKVEAAKEKEKLVADEKRRVAALRAAALAADAAVEERRRKTEAVYAVIDRKAEADAVRMAEREAVVLERQRLAKIEVEKRNAAKQLAARERIAQVLDAQSAKQRAKRVAYEAKQAANAARRQEKAVEEEAERKKEIKRIEDMERKNKDAYTQAQAVQAKRIEDIVAHSAVRGKVFGEITRARAEAHRSSCARNENKQNEIRENVARYMRVHEVRRRQMEARIDEEDLRVHQVAMSKKDLLFKRNVAAHEAVARKQMIREELGKMKQTQNFKGLNKLIKMAGGDFAMPDPEHMATTGRSATTGHAEPGSPKTPAAE